MEVLKTLLIVALISHESLAEYAFNGPWVPYGQHNAYDTQNFAGNTMPQKRFINLGTTIIRRRFVKTLTLK